MTENNTKQCPYCKSDIPADAIKCKFCGEFVEKKEEVKKVERNVYNSMPIMLKYKWFQFAPQIYCPHCHYEWKAKIFTKGNSWIELVLRFTIIPWLIYTLRRSWSKQRVCPKCWNPQLIEINP